MALFSTSSLSPHSLMPLSCSSTKTSSSTIKLFSPLTRFSKNPQAFISSVPSTRVPSLSRLQLQPIRSSTSAGPSSSSAHGSEGEGDRSPPSSRIFIKGLSRSTSEGCLLKTFSCFGEISKVKLITSKTSKQPLGLAYIWFACEEDALAAVKEMDGKVHDCYDGKARSPFQACEDCTIQFVTIPLSPAMLLAEYTKKKSSICSVVSET